MQFLALMIDGFRESRDRKLFWVMLLMSLSVASAMFCVAFKPNGVDILFGTWQIETDVFTIGDEVRADIVATVLVEWIADTHSSSAGLSRTPWSPGPPGISSRSAESISSME